MTETGFDLSTMTPRERYEWDRRGFIRFLEEDFRRLIFEKDVFISEIKITLEGEFFRHVEFKESRINLLSFMYVIDEVIFDAIYVNRYGYLVGTLAVDIWEFLLKSGIIKKQWRSNFVAHGGYIIDMMVLTHHLDDRTFHNIFFPPSEIYKRSSSMIVSIDVETKSGDIARGSGFIVGQVFDLMGPSLPRPRILVTCRHNIEGVKIKEVNTGDSTKILISDPYISEIHDIALFPISVFINEFPIPLRGQAEVFDNVYTIGYPLIPRSDSSLLGHRGEVNGFANRYQERDRVLLISNIVSPGSSGCPVVDSVGRCVGMTINWLEGKYGENDQQSARFSAAIPISTIANEIVTAGLSWWSDADSPIAKLK